MGEFSSIGARLSFRTAGAIILRIAYGYRIQEDSDPFVTLADESTNAFSGCVAPGAFLVNMIPIRTFLPLHTPR